jgi:hypothetical protein
VNARLLGVSILATVVLACGSVAGSGGTPSPTPPAATVMVTNKDHNQTVTVHVGDHVQIALGDAVNWQLDPPDGVVLTHPVQNYMLIRGTQAIWLASAAGRAKIHAQGGPNCPSGQACPLILAIFDATVEVLP